MLDVAQLESLQRRKQRTLIGVIIIAITLTLAFVFHFVSSLNDSLAGRPPYAKALTKLMAEEFGRVAEDRFPVLLLGENDHCDPIPPIHIADDQIAGILYALTYSERQGFSCITSYAVPTDPSKFAGLETFRPQPQWMAGPTISQPLKVLPIARNVHVYSAAYLESLHWRIEPHLPLSANQGANLAAMQYESRNPAIPADEHASIDIDFEKARALVRQPHDKANAWLMRIISALVFCGLCLALSLIQPYRNTSRYLLSYGDQITLWKFLTQNIGQRASTVRIRYYERERARQEQGRKAAAELMLREDLEERLGSTLANLQDEGLRQRIQCCLSDSPDLALMKQLCAEAQKIAGLKSPEQKLALLLESLEPFCTKEELLACEYEASKILTDSGFRSARSYVTGMHDQFRARMRKMEAIESNSEINN